MSTTQVDRPPSRVASLVFHDFEELEAAICDAQVEISQTGAGKFEAGLTRAELVHSVLHFGWERVGFLSHGVNGSGFLLSLNYEEEGRCNGHSLSGGSILLYPPGSEHFAVSPKGTEWVYLMVEPEKLVGLVSGVAGVEPDELGQKCILIRPERRAAESLRATLRRTWSSLRGNPCMLDRQEARAALEQTLLDAFVEAMSEAPGWLSDAHPAKESHSRIVSRARQYLLEHLNETIYMADVCQAIKVSERTLRTAFQEIWSVSPNRYLKARRLNQVRRVLRKSSPDDAAVGRVAMHYGFWDMSRFAVEYRRLFGEKPSQTLRNRR
jgi:AraC family transcriptional regulator, ethanolamine operon transcriptional activator